MKTTSNRTYYHKVQDHSLPISDPAVNLEALEIAKIFLNPLRQHYVYLLLQLVRLCFIKFTKIAIQQCCSCYDMKLLIGLIYAKSMLFNVNIAKF
jgi:hypothetical protein